MIQKLTLSCYLVIILAVVSGCGDRVIAPRMIRKKPVTFEPGDWAFGEKTTMVEVIEFFDNGYSIVWKIKAKDAVPSYGFKVEVGNVPDGFEQVVPIPSKKFTPISGKEYRITIMTDRLSPRGPPFAGGESWIAK